jgi:glycosyltransferase involved in cell wall biosynthesis
MMQDRRPLILTVAPFLTPFRAQFYERILREMPDHRLGVVVTQNPEHGPWRMDEVGGVPVRHLGLGKPWQHAERGWKGRWRSLRADMRTFGDLARILDEERPSAVFLVGYGYWSHTRLILRCHRLGVPLFLWGDSNVLADNPRGVRGMVKRMLLPRVIGRCAAVLPCGSSGRAFFQRYGAREDRMFLCPADPDYRLIDVPEAGVVGRVGREFGLDPARKRIMCCARLVGLKRFDAAIDAFVRLVAERPEWDLFIVGDGEMRSAWEARVPAELKARVIWAGFVKEPERIAACYQWSHVFVHPGDYEAWGVVVLEAAAAGLAMVVSEVVGAAPDLVKDGENGRLVPPGDSAAVERALREITDPSGEHTTLVRMRARSREISLAFRREADAIAGLKKALALDGTR